MQLPSDIPLTISDDNPSCGEHPYRSLRGQEKFSAYEQSRKRKSISSKHRRNSRTKPPLLVLTVYDEGGASGEEIRIRNPKFVIGRKFGDLTIGIDQQISSRHVKIAYSPTLRGTGWRLFDMNSRNGTYVRTRGFQLDGSAEFFVGRNRFRFKSAQASPTGKMFQSVVDHSDETIDPSSQADVCPVASLVQMHGSREGNRVLLTGDDYRVSGDANSPVLHGEAGFIDDDFMRLARTPRGDWRIDRERSRQILWRRMQRVSIDRPIQFKIGSQLFCVRAARS